MQITPLSLAGAYRVELDRLEDDRGYFARMYCKREFAALGLVTEWVQINTSQTKAAGSLRGMHFQRPPSAEAKLITCAKGRVFDVLVDLRANSATFGQWEALELSCENRTQVYVPGGVAHGFQTLVDDVTLVYMHDSFYAPGQEGGVHYSDPEIGICWPLPIAEVSARDAALPFLRNSEPISL